MIFIIQLSLDEFDIALASIDIPVNEKQNVKDAFICEMEYNSFDMEI